MNVEIFKQKKIDADAALVKKRAEAKKRAKVTITFRIAAETEQLLNELQKISGMGRTRIMEVAFIPSPDKLREIIAGYEGTE